MIDAGEAPRGHDSGVHHPTTPTPTIVGKRVRPRRSLATWVLVAAALVIGWLLGSLLGSSSTGQSQPATGDLLSAASADPTVGPADAPPAADPPIEPLALPAMQTSPSQTTPGQTAPDQTIPLSDAALVLAQLSGSDRLPSAVTSIGDLGSWTVRVDQRIAGPTQAVGEVGKRVQVVGDSVIFVAGRQALVIDIGSTDEPEPIVDAATLLAGSGPGDVWALADQSRTLRLIDVASRSIRATYDLSTIGVPLASYDGGLIVGPDVDTPFGFGLWSPARGFERPRLLDRHAFVDAAGNVIVMHNEDGLAVYNTVTGRRVQTERTLTDDERANAFVSPAGTQLAVVKASITSPWTTVEVLELATGATIDEFVVFAPWLLHWAADGELLYLAPGTGTPVTLRDTSQGEDTALVSLGSEITWMIIAE